MGNIEMNKMNYETIQIYRFVWVLMSKLLGYHTLLGIRNV